MVLVDTSNMVEFSEDMSLMYTGRDALAQRIRNRLLITKDSVPYISGGSPITPFESEDPAKQARDILSDLVSDVEVLQDGTIWIASIDLKISSGE